jgi:thioredoxin reductase (NADPH)
LIAPSGLTLLVRAYCHLCDEMRAAVRPLAANAGLTLDEIDVDADPALEARWGELVPVLLAGERELCHYRFDRAAFAAYLRDAG